MKPINVETDQQDLVAWLEASPKAAAPDISKVSTLQLSKLPKHVLRKPNVIVKHTPHHVDYTCPGHKYPMRYFITGPFAGTGLEMSPAIIERNAAVLEGMA